MKPFGLEGRDPVEELAEFVERLGKAVVGKFSIQFVCKRCDITHPATIDPIPVTQLIDEEIEKIDWVLEMIREQKRQERAQIQMHFPSRQNPGNN